MRSQSDSRQMPRADHRFFATAIPSKFLFFRNSGRKTVFTFPGIALMHRILVGSGAAELHGFEDPERDGKQRASEAPKQQRIAAGRQRQRLEKQGVREPGEAPVGSLFIGMLNGGDQAKDQDLV